jgi:hypothetical protein
MVVVALYFRMQFETWIAQKNDRIVKDIFKKAGADRPFGAARLEELGFKFGFWSVGLYNFGLFRNFKHEALRRMISMGEIQLTQDGRYYLVANTDAFDRNPRR